MTFPVSLHDVRPRQTARRSTRALHQHHRRSSSSSTTTSDGCYCQRDSPMTAKPSPTMSHPSQPPGTKRHVLHRQPRLSSIRQQDLVELKSVSPWTTREKDTSTADEWAYRNSKQSMAESFNDVSRRSGAGSSDDSGVAMHRSTPHATPHRWEHSRPSTYASRSFEWETETLFEQHIGRSDFDMVSYPCPYRKRNPARFNFRDHESCARGPFTSVVDLLHHISDEHRRKPIRHRCPRCKQTFHCETDLEKHLLLPREQMCEVDAASPDDPEDGITDELAMVMVTAGFALEERWTWEKIWHWVFPDDPEVPDSEFPPFAELVEIEQAFDDGQEALKASLREKLKLLLPGPLDDDYLSFLAGQLELVFETHRVNVIKQSVGRHSSPTCQPAPPETQTNHQQQNSSHKPNRRSRRITMFQTLHRNNTPETTFRRHSRTDTCSGRGATSRQSSPEHMQSSHHDNMKTGHPTRPQTNRTFTGLLEAIRSSQDTILKDITQLDFNPRDSRDSGIGMPCEHETCQSAMDSEPCRCGGETAALSLPSGIKNNTRIDDHDHTPHLTHHGGPLEVARQERNSLPSWIQSRSTAAAAAAPAGPAAAAGYRRGSYQPRLSIDTDTPHLRDMARGEEWAVESAGGVSGGRYSPESFKQRVLRGRLMGV